MHQAGKEALGIFAVVELTIGSVLRLSGRSTGDQYFVDELGRRRRHGADVDGRLLMLRGKVLVMVVVVAHLACHDRLHVDPLIGRRRRQRQVRCGGAPVPAAAGPGPGGPRRQLAERLAARLAAVLVVPEALARLERLVAARARVRTQVRVRPFVCAHRSRVLETLATHAAFLAQLVGVLEQHVLLEVVALLEPAASAPRQLID